MSKRKPTEPDGQIVRLFKRHKPLGAMGMSGIEEHPPVSIETNAQFPAEGDEIDPFYFGSPGRTRDRSTADMVDHSDRMMEDIHTESRDPGIASFEEGTSHGPQEMRLNEPSQAPAPRTDPFGSIGAESQWYLLAHINNFFETGHARLTQKIDAIEESVMKELASLRASMDNKYSATGTEEDSPFRRRVKAHVQKMILRPHVSPGTLGQCTATSMAIEVVDYEHGMNPGPTVGNFRIDAASGPYSKWNDRASQVFADDFCATEYPEAVGKSVADTLSEFRTLLPIVSANLVVAAGFENLESYRRFYRSFSKRLRTDRKAESRLSAANRLRHPQIFVPIVRKLVEDDGMSCDEEDTDGYVHAATPTWRSISATRWLRSLDKSFLHPPGSPSREVSAKGTGEPVGLRVPRSLPENFYSPVYLEGLDGVQYADLNLQPVVDIEF